MRNALLSLLTLTSFVITAPAATVTSSADSGPGSLRQAIADAAPGETISLAVTGVITLTSGELAIDKDLTIIGPGSTNLTIQRSTASGTPDFRIFSILQGTVALSGSTIRNGRALEGGGIYAESDVLLQDVVVADNAATLTGGGIHSIRANLVMSNCVIARNIASGPGMNTGGGIENGGTTLTAWNVRIVSNAVVAATAAFGGGINNGFGGTLNMTNSVISGNRAIAGAGSESGGGGIFNQGDILLHTTTVGSNSAIGGAGVAGGTTEGGGIASDLGNLKIDRTTVSGNVAVGGNSSTGFGGAAQGGGIAASGGEIELHNSTLSGNAAQGGTGSSGAGVAQGGGLFITFGSVLDATNSTITANQGHGVFNTDSAVANFKNSILAGNLGAFDLFTTHATDVFSGGFNLFGSLNTTITAGPGDQFNITAATVRLGPLRDNGGPTFTHALLCGSPAIDAGDNTAAPPTDQRGFPRIVNGRIDIGSFELSNAPPTVVCAPPGGSLCVSSPAPVPVTTVTVTDADGDSLVVIWMVDGTALQTNLIAGSGPPTTATVQLIAALSAGSHQITVSVADPSECVAACSTTLTITSRGDLYPIALHVKNLEGVPIGAIIPDIYNGVQPGNFGWLTWAGNPNEPTLVKSLTPPGNSSTYINPRDRMDRVVSVGDWVQGKPGVSNSDKVRGALNTLQQIDITVPVWDQAISRGNNSLYRVAAFARVRIVSYRLPQQNRISARFLGFVPCN